MLKHHLIRMYLGAYEHNTQNIKKALSSVGPHRVLLDVGCWDGKNTLVWKKAAGAEVAYGIEPNLAASRLANRNNIRTLRVQADKPNWRLPPGSVDCIISNQVIEHLSDIDTYYQQCRRVLKKGGYLITSTNNLSSWHNIVSLVLGWSPFDLANSSKKSLGVGNPASIHRGQSDSRGSTWVHKCVYTTKWLSEWGRLYGLEFMTVYGAGYYPFPSSFAQLDKTHCALITLVQKKI